MFQRTENLRPQTRLGLFARDALLETFHHTMHLLPSIKMEIVGPINPQLSDLSLSGSLDPLPDEWKIFPWSRIRAIRFLSVLAGRLRRSGSMASIFNLAILPQKENGAGLASRNRSRRRQNFRLLAPRISKTIYSKSTVLSIRRKRKPPTPPMEPRRRLPHGISWRCFTLMHQTLENKLSRMP